MKENILKINCSKENVIDKRIEWIDIAKGIGIILVVIAHTQMPSYSMFYGNDNVVRLLIYSFHMPLFFFLSGMCFKNDGITFKEFLAKKIKTLILPYFTFSVIWIAFESALSILNHSFSLNFLLREFKSYLLQIRNHAIWFLTCLFVLELVFFVISKVLKRKLFLVVFTILFLLLGVIYRERINANLVWNIDIIPMAMPFFTLGFLLKPYILKIKGNNLRLFLAFIICMIMNQITNAVNCKFFGKHYIGMYENSYCNYILFYLSAFLGIMAIVELSKVFEKSIIKKPLIYIGKNSLLYFGLHQILLLIAQIIINHLNLTNALIIVIWLLIVVATFLIITLLNQIVIKTKLKILIGK